MMLRNLRKNNQVLPSASRYNLSLFKSTEIVAQHRSSHSDGESNRYAALLNKKYLQKAFNIPSNKICNFGFHAEEYFIEFAHIQSIKDALCDKMIDMDVDGYFEGSKLWIDKTDVEALAQFVEEETTLDGPPQKPVVPHYFTGYY